MSLTRWASLIATFVFAYLGEWLAAGFAGAICVTFLIIDAARNPSILRGAWIPVTGAVIGLSVCWLVGFALVKLIGSSETVYVGPGFDRWNLPGTILGLSIWVSSLVYALKKRP